MTPYYERDGITVYHADCREVLPTLEAGSVDLVLTDPPYGIGLETMNARKQARSCLAYKRDWPAIVGDDAPFDPAHLLRFPRLVLFGANYYADRLPPSASWIVWDKLAGLTSRRSIGFNDYPDAELAWTNLGGPLRIMRERWMGVLNTSENGRTKLHPTQKPVALMAKIIQWRTEPGSLILDPYMGSGPTLRAAKDLGRRAIGIEIDERYCEVAARRLMQTVLPLDWAAAD